MDFSDSPQEAAFRAEAHAWLAWMALGQEDDADAPRARRYYLAAYQHRARLSPRSRALLDAIEPLTRTEADAAAFLDRTRAVAEDRPGDPEALHALAWAHQLVGQPGKAVTSARDAVVADPWYHPARVTLAEALAPRIKRILESL